MKIAYLLSALAALLMLGCQPPELSPEEVFQNSVASLHLNSPADQEMPLGASLDLRASLNIAFKEGQPMSVPGGAIQYLANNKPLASSTFEASYQGTYTLQARIGDKVSNPISVTVLPFSLVRIPVVFHAVNTTLSQAQVDRMISSMTEAFRNRWNPYNGARDANAVDNFVEFYAVDKDPSGRTLSVSGLDPVTSSRQTFTSEQAVNEAWKFYWNPSRYLNVWIYDLDKKESISGFAYFVPVTRPQIGSRLVSASYRKSSDLPYGIYFNKSQVNNSRSNTLAHEVGHVLGLEHVFDGNGDEHNGCSTVDPDYCADTPFYDRNIYMDNYRSMQQRRTACDGSTFESTNHMDYYISYANSFTRLQRDRMRHTLNYGLWIPTPFNAAARLSAEDGYMEKPDDYRYRPPVVCGLEE